MYGLINPIPQGTLNQDAQPWLLRHADCIATNTPISGLSRRVMFVNLSKGTFLTNDGEMKGHTDFRFSVYLWNISKAQSSAQARGYFYLHIGTYDICFIIISKVLGLGFALNYQRHVNPGRKT
jgi:hypothetical protein